MFLTNCSPTVQNGGQNGKHRCRRVPITYKQVYKNYKNNNLTQFCFILTMTWSLPQVVGNNRINDDKKCRESAGDFDHHADAAVQCRVHCLMEHIPGFTRSHWMPSLGECLRSIAPAAAMVDKYIENTQNTNKNYFQLATTVQIDHQLFMRISYPQKDPLLSSLMQQAA